MSGPYTGGASVSFSGTGVNVSPEEITRITVNRSAASNNRQRVSIAHLGSPMGSGTARLEEPYVEIWQPTDGSGSTLDVEYIGAPINVSGGVSGTLGVSGPFSISVTNATLSSSVISGSVGDLVRGTLSFRF